MVGFVMTNSQMGVSYFERIGLFASNYNCNSIPWRPIFPNGSCVRKIRVLSVKLQNSGIISALKEESDNRLVGGGLIEKELEFKPSFSEYVKTMELVRVRRDKNQANDWKKYKQRGDSTEKDLSRTSPTEGGEENLKLEEFECCLEEEKTFKVVERESLSVHEYGGMGKESCVGGKLSYKGKGTKQFKYENDARGSNVNARLGKKPGGGTPKVILSKHKTVITGQEMDNSHVDRSSKARNARKSSRSLGPVQSKRHRIDVEGKRVSDANSLGMLRKKGNEGGHGDPKSPWKTFKEEKIGVRQDNVQGRLEKKYIQVEEEANNRLLCNYGKFTRGSRASSERIDGDGLEVERAAFKTFDESNDVVDKPRVSRMEMEERIQRLANLLNGAAIDMPEWMFAKMMRSARIRFSDHSVLRIIQLLGKLGNWRRVLEVIEWLQIRERFKSHKLRFIYTTALDVLGKANRPVEALNVFHSMQQHMSSYPDIVAYHCIAVTLGQAGFLKELFDVIDTMRSPPKKKFKTGALGEWDPRLEPDVIVYNSVLNACVHQKQWEGAFWVLQQLKQQGQQPSSTTYGLVMEVMFACGKYNLVHEFFRKLQKSSIPNALTYKVVVNTLWQEGKTDEAVLVVQDMERRGIVGSAALYYDLARCLCSAGRCQDAAKQIEQICQVANKPLVVTYTGLIQACLDSGHIQDGTYIFSKMQNFCSPNLVTCNIMLKAYLLHGMFEEAKDLFHKMSENGNHFGRKSDYGVQVIPDVYTFNIMLAACIAEERWDDFENIYRRMLHNGYHFNAKRHLRMILDASRAGKGELLETTWNHLARADRTAPSPLIKERFLMKLENDDYAAALACVTSHPVVDLQAFSTMAWLNLFNKNAHRFRKDALFRLINEVSVLVSRTELQNPVVHNLISACKEFCRTQMTLAEIKQIEAVSTVQTELALKS